jgi:hypothetical protein
VGHLQTKVEEGAGCDRRATSTNQQHELIGIQIEKRLARVTPWGQETGHRAYQGRYAWGGGEEKWKSHHHWRRIIEVGAVSLCRRVMTTDGKDKQKAWPPLKKERSRDHIFVEEWHAIRLNLTTEKVTVQTLTGERRRHSGESGPLWDGFIFWWAGSAASPHALGPSRKYMTSI